ncbi:hypothetical protein U14_00610 [Candidatus Moduliflexus flocculans]|uniref:Uncharacterized protein n=1 Tax=Candidatus Moduliflexus flocculans TaxID=1499966 RepID=A0A0S6VUP2_9BACT|nr:hypothetical protein U14_00610 [Candidatus Moduliflexus flocculans]
MNHSETTPEARDVAPYLREIEVVAQRGHKDPSTENLLLALVNTHHNRPDIFERFATLLLQLAQQQQLEITPRAFRLSLLTAIKLYLRKSLIKEYESFSIASWQQVVRNCLSEYDEEFLYSCLRDVSTVKIYRYIALQLVGGILKHSNVMPPQGVCILDGGCSINIGLKCLNNLDIFRSVQLSQELVMVFGGNVPDFPIKCALGIDKYPPDLERTLASLFPSEVKRWENLYTRLYYLDKSRIRYQQQDFLFLERNEEFRSQFDIIFLSSLLRRLSPHQVADALRQAHYATTPHSFVVINEQMAEETIEGGGNYATFILPKTLLERVVLQAGQEIKLYDLLNMAYQVFVYPDENCQSVHAGSNFHDFVREYSWLSAERNAGKGKK